jgi:uncharacterized membrane protein YgdD (TMEM256/DUF423 family)
MLAGIRGFLGVAFGAFGAHGLKNGAQKQADGEQRLTWWQTASQYHLVHALAIGAVRPCLAAVLSHRAIDLIERASEGLLHALPISCAHPIK